MVAYVPSVNELIGHSPEQLTNARTLQSYERLHYRNLFRAARYAALADAEGFGDICFALEALGLRLLGKKGDMGRYECKIRKLAADSIVLSDLSTEFPQYFSKFDALYVAVRLARNDAMHTGVYARHVTLAAIELCIGIEEALMKGQEVPRRLVADFMVKAPVCVEVWQPVACARQLMLMHSFSFLPVFHERWRLLSEVSMVKYLNCGGNLGDLLAAPIERAEKNGLKLIDAKVVELDANVTDLLATTDGRDSPRLWLVEDRPGKLAGILSPFELM